MITLIIRTKNIIKLIDILINIIYLSPYKCNLILYVQIKNNDKYIKQFY